MLRGHLDAITTTGYIEGWACDDERPLSSLVVSIVANDVQIAYGICNRYRWDLADARLGVGWCAFHLKLVDAAQHLKGQVLGLIDTVSGKELFRATMDHPVQDNEPSPSTPEEIIRSDPTIIGAVEQIKGCAAVFSEFIRLHGNAGFVRRAFLYVLNRPANHSEIEVYSKALGEESITAYGILQSLYESEEFRTAPRLLLAPPEPGFAFRWP
jgi:hypothetical protein